MKRIILFTALFLLAGLAGVATAAPWTDASGLSTNGITTCAKYVGPVLPSSLWSCWGDNTYGQIGNGNTATVTIPTLTHNNFAQMSVGRFHSCGIDTTNKLYCWGRNDFGQVGNGTTGGNVLAPVAVASNFTYAHVSVGGYHTCAVLTSGYVQCWGAGGNGQQGDGTFGNRSFPSPTNFGAYTYKVVAGWAHNCLIDDVTRALKCWGQNAAGQVGNNSLVDATTPVPVRNSFNQIVMNNGVEDVAGGWYSTCALQGQFMRCWGANTYGQLATGNGSSTGIVKYVPSSAATFNDRQQGVKFQGPVRNVKITAESACARAYNSQRGYDAMYCWGRNHKLQVEMTGGTPYPTFFEPVLWTSRYGASVPAAPSPGILRGGGAYGYSVGHEHVCGWWERTPGTVDLYCAGGNDFGQRGAGTAAPSHAAMRVAL